MRHDHADELVDHADVGLLEHSLLDRPQTFAASWRSEDGIARGGGGKKQIAAGRVQASGIVEQRQLQRSHLLRRRLAGLGHAHCSIGGDGDRSRAWGDGDGRLNRVSVLRDQVALGIEMKTARAGVGGLTVREEHLKEPLALNG